MAGEGAAIALLLAGKLQPQWLQKIALRAENASHADRMGHCSFSPFFSQKAFSLSLLLLPIGSVWSCS